MRKQFEQTYLVPKTWKQENLCSYKDNQENYSSIRHAGLLQVSNNLPKKQVTKGPYNFTINDVEMDEDKQKEFYILQQRRSKIFHSVDFKHSHNCVGCNE